METARCQEGSTAMSGRDFERLSSFIYGEVGIKLPPVKKTMLEARLQKRLRALSLPSFGAYCDYLFSPEGTERELVQMIDLVTTNKTDFFREPDHFEFLTHRVLPEWYARQRGSQRCFKAWSAGCSSGEEPYTLAMVLAEFAERTPGFTFQILATDISTRVLEKARLGVYEEERVDPVPLPMKKKYLLRGRDQQLGNVRVASVLREAVRFRRLNFMAGDFGFRETMDVIFCRNVIIYFDRPTQERLLGRFCRYMGPGSYIFMGHSETLNGLDVPLTLAHPTVYRKPK